MQAGTWARLAVGNQDPALGVGSISGTMIHYCNSMPWNPMSKAIEILGADHNYPQIRHVRFNALINRFELIADNAGVGTGHGYDHVALNRYRRPLRAAVQRLLGQGLLDEKSPGRVFVHGASRRRRWRSGGDGYLLVAWHLRRRRCAGLLHGVCHRFG